MQPGWPHPQHSRQAEAPEPAQGQLPTKPLLSHRAMECRAEIRFAIFLLCLLVPLGSMAPTETSGQRQNRFTTEIPTYAAVLQQNAHELFKFYNKCISAAFQPESQTVQSDARKLADTIPTCQAFQANCCALHHIQNNLETLEGEIETICPKSSRDVVGINLEQLNTTLGQGTAFYSCRSQDLPQLHPQFQKMDLADRISYIWWVLNKYEDIMEFTGNLYSEATVRYARMKK